MRRSGGQSIVGDKNTRKAAKGFIIIDCGYPFYSARYSLPSAGFGRNLTIKEPMGGERRISTAKRTLLTLSQTLVLQGVAFG